MKPLRIFTWHIHGSYLYYLSQIPHEIYLPVYPGQAAANGYYGRTPSYPWPANVREIPINEVPKATFDVILYQSHQNVLSDQFEILSESQRRLPRIYLEHDPPREHPTDTRHPVDDPNVLVVHVTPFNDLMWDCGRSPTRVIDHGVMVPHDVRYQGHNPRGIAVVNNMAIRGRRLGADVYQRARSADVPLDLVGMGWEEVDGGIGEKRHYELPGFVSQYRFFFNPIRYTSLGLAVCEAMMIGMPIVGLRTTEMVTVIENGESGYLDTDVNRVIDAMHELVRDPAEAKRLGEGAKRYAMERFGIERFVRDWNETLAQVTH